MSCLPLFSFSPSLPAILKPFDDTVEPSTHEQESPLSLTASASDSRDVVDDLYDKLSRVSVSHRRVDSFEWVMTQSAPNTPPTSHESTYEPYSPPPIRRVGSAPLPVPDETWSVGPQVSEGRRKRGYFDWLSSPILGQNKGYAKLSTTDDEDQIDPESSSIGRNRESKLPQPRVGAQTPTSPYSDCDQVKPSQELNALGIVFPYTPPPSPPTSKVSPTAGSGGSFRSSAPRPSKRVSFSPIVNEAAFQTAPELYSTENSSSWGSYLPSSFLVARPPLPRAASSPTPRRVIATRPILKRSTSTYQDPVCRSTPITEMTQIAPRTDEELTPIIASPIPSQRLSPATMRADGHRLVGGNSGDTDSAFVAILQSKEEHARRRCDSLLSDTSLPVLDQCRSF